MSKKLDKLQTEMILAHIAKKRKHMSGWDDLEAEPAAFEPDQDRVDLNLQMAKAFASAEGQKVLAWMREFYLEHPCWQPGSDNTLGMFREGQNSVVRDIEKRIRIAKRI
jgi:hypothetical protein